ncbi:MAG: pitrilysin family protein [bacterium]|nr:pitrilysin family protein [bacterium]
MQFHKTILPNGLRLIVVPMKESATVTVMALVEAGSKYETKDINGLSHFLEHMCFKGTAKRPHAIDISRELDAIGAQYNAFTSQEFTGYFAKSAKQHFQKILSVVSDIYLHPSFPEPEIEKEKGVIVEEINMYRDLPQKHVQDLFLELLYGDQPAGWNIAGTPERVRALSRADFVAYREKHYVSGATTVVVAGAVSPEEAREAVARAFEGMSTSAKHPKITVVENQNAPSIRIEPRSLDQAHFVLGARSFNAYDKLLPALKVMAGALGAGMSSRLFQRMREELGICYYVKTDNDALTDHGFFTVSAGVAPSRAEEALRAVLAEFARLRDEPLSEEELRKVKDCMVGNMYLSLESTDELAEFYGMQEVLRKELKQPDEIAKEIEKVDSKDIQEIARLIFKPERLNLAIVGQAPAEMRLQEVLTL